mgnify:FL=1
MQLPLDAEDLVPHRRPMRLVDRLLSIEGKNGVVEADVSSDCPLVDADGVLESIALIELIAQGYAALKGYLDRLENKPVRQGVLVGIKKLVCMEPAKVGDRLKIEIKTLGELDDFAVAEGQIWCADKLVARGEIKVWFN